MTQSARAVLQSAQWSCSDIDWFVGHQANIRILQRGAYELGLPESRVAANIDRTGTTLTASVPLF